MRGLTPAERRLLHARAANAPREEFVYPSSGCDVYLGLQAVGRTVGRYDASDGFIVNYITDLGRLALRVCPVDEA